jgi:hypothetical protein
MSGGWGEGAGYRSLTRVCEFSAEDMQSLAHGSATRRRTSSTWFGPVQPRDQGIPSQQHRNPLASGGFVVGRPGLEPGTCGLRVRCSAN